VVYKELPVLGPQSLRLAQMALAVYLIDDTKYVDFHNALMDANTLDDKALDEIFKKLNINKTSLTEMMKDDRIKKELNDVALLAQKLNIRGTPAFIIDEIFVPGGIKASGIKELVGKARASKSGK
jgi:protein-disulfide isomerase